MATTVDLKVGLNLEIGSLPVSLSAEVDKQSDQTVYTFDGCLQSADISLSDFFSAVSQQFGVDIQLPSELQLDIKIDYIAGQVTVTQPQTGTSTTELGVSGKFELFDNGKSILSWQFYADTRFGGQSPSTGNPYVIGFALDTDLVFSELPVVGKIPGINQLTLQKLGFSYTNADATTTPFNIPQVQASANPLYTTPSIDSKDKNVYSIGTDGKQQTFNLQSKGFSLTAGLINSQSGEVVDNFALPMALPSAPPGTPAFYGQKTSPPASPIHWINLNKTFGPVSLQQIGLNYSGGEATFGFSAGMTMGGFMLSLQGLSITFPLPLPGQKAGSSVSFDLDGLAMDINKGGLQVGGAFLKAIDPDKSVSYYGEVIIQVANFGLKAVGGYSPGVHPASFFIYLNIDVPLGGPPFLFVTGLAGGFGINRSLILPTVDQLPGCLLLPGNAPPAGATPADTIKSVIPALQTMFHNEPGEYWVAVGIQFTSFEMIQAFALVTVAFGVDLQIGLIGTCSMTFPTGDTAEAIAYVEIDIVASFTASTGQLAVDGRLSPASYIYGGFVHLSGGFAFYTWFSGPHKGDFVVSLGGYHPSFNKPDYYPAVPRLAMAFGLGPFQVLGQAYFALTPSMMMAGISLSATWNSGPLKVWFDAGVDFLIGWAPFHYEADAYVHFGISLHLGLITLSLHAGAEVYIWGPKFGGTAHVDLDVVSFTINFGAKRAAPPPVGWSDFKTKFLPQESQASQSGAQAMFAAPPPATVNIVKADVSVGLLQKDLPGYNWIIDPNGFTILTSSTIPSNNAAWNVSDPKQPSDANIPNTLSSYQPPSGLPLLTYPESLPTFSKDQVWNTDVHIKPMGLQNVQSYHTITLYQRDENGTFSLPVTGVAIQPVLLNSSTALWGQPGQPTNPNATPLALSALTGFMIMPIPRHPDQVSNVLLYNLLFQSGYTAGFSYTGQAVDSSFTVNETIDSNNDLNIAITGASAQNFENEGLVLSVLTNTWVVQQRNAVLADLISNQFSTYTAEQIDLNALATQKALTDWPVVELMGA